MNYLVILFAIITLPLINSSPQAIIHVGPPKTASTWVESILSIEAKSILENENYYDVPADTDGNFIKKDKFLGFCLDPEFYTDSCELLLKKIQLEIKDHLILGHNVYTTSEAYSSPTLKVDQLINMFDGFDIKILAIYRDRFSWLISAHNTYLLTTLKEIHIKTVFQVQWLLASRIEFGNLKRILDRYLTYIPRTELFIFDLAGVTRTGTDIVEAIIKEAFTEISISGVEKMKNKIQSIKSRNVVNHSQDLRIVQMIKFFLSKYNMTGDNEDIDPLWQKRICFLNEIPKLSISNYSTCESGLKNNYINGNQNNHDEKQLCIQGLSMCDIQLEKLPLKCVDSRHLSAMKKTTVALDREIRLEFGDRLYYGNITANKEIIYKLLVPTVENHLCELDDDLAFQNVKTIKMIEEIFKCCFSVN